MDDITALLMVKNKVVEAKRRSGKEGPQAVG